MNTYPIRPRRLRRDGSPWVRLLVALALLLAPSSALADPPADLAERVETLRQSFGVPGMTVAIVENGETTFARGFGRTELEGGRAVDADTNFATGSTGKAFTSAALAILVDQGRIRWDDRVIDHMPDFRMYDPWVTREMTIRDLLVHRSGLGLGAGDLLFVPRSNLSREETVRRLRHIRPATSFRSAYAYDNILYIVAGQLIEEVSGQSWERFMLEQVLRPAGMNRVTVDGSGRRATRNLALPHARLNGPVRGLGDLVELDESAAISDNAAPAGGLTVSAKDMTKWLALQLARGDLPGEARLFSEAQAREMWNPAVLMPVRPLPGPLAATQPMFSTYALGWNVRDYHGHRIVMHSGGVYGSIAMVVLIPERNTGFYIALNSEDAALLSGLTYELLDHYLGAPRADWPAHFRSFLDQRLAAAAAALQAPAAQPAEVGPSLPLARYAGRYTDPWFGTIAIREEGGTLHVDWPHWPGLTATLEHHQYDTFRTRFSDPAVEPAFVTFALGPNGDVDRITLRAVSPAADFSYDYHDLLFTPADEAE
ncbi:serine hydrolase [Sphingosinicella sp. CPCC 101087]|uniref:serine hydrolase n=1 Tax=Sphingosinicella sp. CPCC 101087 TaxID=2497754 RepID=UPI00101BB312|nr:serine hydrolase [Sphingosinicella sp. CPCC 101087]